MLRPADAEGLAALLCPGSAFTGVGVSGGESGTTLSAAPFTGVSMAYTAGGALRAVGGALRGLGVRSRLTCVVPVSIAPIAMPGGIGAGNCCSPASV